jgi:hypothetical protein
VAVVLTAAAAVWSLPLGASEASPTSLQATNAPAVKFRRWNDLSSDTKALVDRMTESYATWEFRFVCIEEAARFKGDGRQACHRCRGYQRIEASSTGVPGSEVLRWSDPACEQSERCGRDDAPEPLDWLTLLRDPVRSTLLFSEEPSPDAPDRALFLRWASAAPQGDLARVTAWSGLFEIDRESGLLRRIEAVPTWEKTTREARRMRRQTAFRVLGFPLAPRPVMRAIDVRFEISAKGLSWPSAIRLRKADAVTRDEDYPFEEQTAVYHSYRFFESSANEGPRESKD